MKALSMKILREEQVMSTGTQEQFAQFITQYNQAKAQRQQEGIPPLPLTKEQTQNAIAICKSTESSDEQKAFVKDLAYSIACHAKRVVKKSCCGN